MLNPDPIPVEFANPETPLVFQGFADGEGPGEVTDQTVHFPLLNPNTFDVRVAGVTFGVEEGIASMEGEGADLTPVVIPAGQVVAVPIRFDFLDSGAGAKVSGTIALTVERV